MEAEEQRIGDATPQRPSIVDGHEAVPVAAAAATTELLVQPSLEIEEAELYFLIADFLKRRSGCQKAADVLIQELTEQKLLKENVDWQGRRKSATYEDYRMRHRDLAPGHLLQLMQQHSAESASRTPEASTTSSHLAHMKLRPSNSLLLKRRAANAHQRLTEAERKALAKNIVRQHFDLRHTARTQAIVEKVIRKYERLQEYLSANSADELPVHIQSELAQDTVTALAADTRALKQLMQLKVKRKAIEGTIARLMNEASRSSLFQSSLRTGKNQASLLQWREVLLGRQSDLPPMHLYSRMRRLKTLNGHLQIPTYCLTYDKTGKFVITGADDRLIKIWSLSTGDLLFTLRGHVGNITDLAVNNSNTLLASSSDDKTVRVWELSTGAPVAVLLGHSSVVNSVRFHPRKNVVVTASDDGRCFCYKLPDIPQVDQAETKQQTAQRLHAIGAYLLSLHPVYSLSHGGNRQGVRSCKVLCLSFSRCGHYVVTGGQDGIGRVWDVSIFSEADGPVVVPLYQPVEQPHIQVVANIPVPQAPVQIQVSSTETTETAQLPVLEEIRTVSPPSDMTAAMLVTPPVPVQLPLADTSSAQLPQSTPIAMSPPLVIGQENSLPRQTQIPQLPQNGLPSASIADIEVPQLPSGELIAYLKGHTGPITNIVYSNSGDRIATASIKDGTTRIWQWTKKYTKMNHKVLFQKEHDENEELASTYGLQLRKKPIPAVDTLTWTRNDKRLITLHSVKPDAHASDAPWHQRVRIWNPTNGTLVMTLGVTDPEKKNGHVNAVFAMDVHPTDWRLVVTAGYDGRVFLWDISTGRILKSFVNTSPESELVAMLDGGFMPNGDGFCFTDRIGRLLIFGTGSRERYAATPVQQYFQNDYAVLVTDRNFNVFDRETQQAPSLMESGPLVDIFRIEYPYQPPHLLSNRATLTPEIYEENRRLRVQQCKESEIKCHVYHHTDEDEIEFFPSAICTDRSQDNGLIAGARPSLANASYRLNGAPVMLSEIRRRYTGQRRQRSSPRIEERDTTVLNIEISSDDDHSDEDFQAPTTTIRDEDDEDEDDDDDEDDIDEDDILTDNDDTLDSPSQLRRHRLRSMRNTSTRHSWATRGGGRLRDENSDDEEQPRRLRRRRMASTRRISDADDEDSGNAEVNHETGNASNDAESSHYRGNDQEDVVVETNDGFIMGANQLDKFDRSISYEQLLELKRQQTDRGHEINEASDEALIPCAFCNFGDDGGMLKLPGDGMGVHPLINGSQRLFVHDQCAIASPLCFNRAGKWYNVTKEIRRGRSLSCVQCKKRGATVGCTITTCPRSYHWKCAISCGWSLNQIQFYCPEHEAARTQEVNADHTTITEDEEPVTKRFGLTFHREWLQRVSLKSTHQYVPQVGDDVVYFPEGHQVYLRCCSMQLPSYLNRFQKYFALKCRVVDIKYVFPLADDFIKSSSIKCELSLAVVAVPTISFRLDDDEETKESELSETPSDLFVFNASQFQQFTGVNQDLEISADRSSTRFCFNLEYHSHDVANFLVLDHAYENGVFGEWKIGQRVQMPYVQMDEFGYEHDFKTTYGVIDQMCPKKIANTRNTLSPWECIKVKWEDQDEEECCVSPWEIEPALSDVYLAKQLNDAQRLSSRRLKGRAIRGRKRSALMHHISQVMTMDMSKAFVYPVDEHFMDYLITVANPIDLTKMLERIRYGYYRQIEAFLADARLLYLNCEKYNVPTSSIAQSSRSIYSALLTHVRTQFTDHQDWSEPDPSEAIQYPLDEPGELSDGDDDIELLAPVASPVSGTRRAPVIDSFPLRIINDDEAPPDITPSNDIDAPFFDHEAHESVDEGQTTPAVSQDIDVTAVLASISDQIQNSPQSKVVAKSPATAKSPARVKRVVRPPEIYASPVDTKKRQARSVSENNVITYDSLLDKLTNEQRSLFESTCEDDLQSVLQDFHMALMQVDEMDIFAKPVTEEEAPNYFKIIKSPMDFGTIMDRIDKYKTFWKYFDDVHIVLSNAILYNGWESMIGGLVTDIQNYSVKFLLDAIGGGKPQSTRSRSSKKAAAPKSVKAQKAKRKAPAATQKRQMRHVIESDDEESWGSEASVDSEEEEEEEEEDEEEDSDADENWNSRSKRKRSHSSSSRQPKRRR